jgi:hypothetical protein
MSNALDTGASEAGKKVTAWFNASPTHNPNYMIDCDGRLIKWSEYGRYSEYGWQIDHANPLALGGSDSPLNLRARHWRGNSYEGGLLGALIGG